MFFRFRSMIKLCQFSILSACLLFFAQHSFGQRSGNYKSDSIDLTRVTEMKISMQTGQEEVSAGTTALHPITISDVRYDTSMVGIYSALRYDPFIPFVKNFKVNIDEGLEHSLSEYLNHSFKRQANDGDREILTFIKSFSISGRDTMKEARVYRKIYAKLKFVTEVFLRSGSNYYAAFKIDTILEAQIDIDHNKIAGAIKERLLTPAFRLLRDEISGTDWQSITNRKSFTKDVLMNHYTKERFAIPVLAEQPVKGVFRYFREFKNNYPYITTFTLEKDKFNTILLADSSGNHIPTIKMFGYCDGDKYWILMGNYCFPLIRVGNGFEFFISIAKNIKILMAMDMEDGTLY